MADTPDMKDLDIPTPALFAVVSCFSTTALAAAVRAVRTLPRAGDSLLVLPVIGGGTEVVGPGAGLPSAAEADTSKVSAPCKLVPQVELFAKGEESQS